MDVWKNYEGKKVFLILKNNRRYEGIILTVEQGEFFAWITMRDKFEHLVTFNSEEISLIKEEE